MDLTLQQDRSPPRTNRFPLRITIVSEISKLDKSNIELNGYTCRHQTKYELSIKYNIKNHNITSKQIETHNKDDKQIHLILANIKHAWTKMTL